MPWLQRDPHRKYFTLLRVYFEIRGEITLKMQVYIIITVIDSEAEGGREQQHKTIY